MKSPNLTRSTILTGLRIITGFILLFLSIHLTGGINTLIHSLSLDRNQILAIFLFIGSLVFFLGHRQFRTSFQLSYHSLILFRIFLGGMIIILTIDKIPSIPDFFMDSGYLNRRDVMWGAGISGGVGLNMIGGGYFSQMLIFILQIFLGIALMLGYRTHLVCLIMFMVELSIQQRNSTILNGGDIIILILFLWGSLLPLGKYFSIHNSRLPGKDADKYVSISTVGALLTICSMYISAGWAKSGEHWLSGDGLNLTLRTEQHARIWAHQLLLYPELLHFLSHAVTYMQKWGWILIFINYRHFPIGRTIFVLFFIGFHFWIALTMYIEAFASTGIIYLFLFLPAFFSRPILQIARWSISPLIIFIGKRLSSPPYKEQWISNILRNTLSLFFIGMVAMYSLWFTALISGNPVINKTMHTLRIGSKWNFFSPNPPSYSMWAILGAQLQNGNFINIITWKPLTKERESCPECIYKHGRHGQQYYFTLFRPSSTHLAERFLNAKKVEWEKNNPRPDHKIVSLALFKAYQKYDLTGYVSPPEFSRVYPDNETISHEIKKIDQHLKNTGTQIIQTKSPF